MVYQYYGSLAGCLKVTLVNDYELLLLILLPRAGSGVVIIDQLHFLAGCRTSD